MFSQNGGALMKDILKLFGIIIFTVLICLSFISCPEDKPETEPEQKPEPEPEPEPSLTFTLINNGTAYSVSKGTFTASHVAIPVVYNGLPVIEIADSGFSS